MISAAMTLPGNATPTRRINSIRRTSHIDMHLDFTLPGDRHLALAGQARDMITDESGVTVIDEASINAGAVGFGALLDLAVTPDVDQAKIAQLIGLPLSSGFRAAVRQAFTSEVQAGTSLALLLDELPVAALISGYAALYAGTMPSGSRDRSAMKSDICSGWRNDGTMMESVHAGLGVPVTLGPKTPTLASEQTIDPDGWHHIDALAVGSMRRRRLLDLHLADDTWEIAAMFRDTHVDPDGGETVLHEYSLKATVDATERRFVTCRAVPRVLPWVECPVAAASADRLDGQSIDEVRNFVRAELVGTSTCTHLNDLLRSLGDITGLAATLHHHLDRR